MTSSETQFGCVCARGFDVYLTRWGEPDESEASYSLETYCDGFLPDMVRIQRLALNQTLFDSVARRQL